MTKRHVVAGTLAIAALSVGCQSTTHQRFSANPRQSEQPKVTVRFVNQPGLEFACSDCGDEQFQLVGDTFKPCNAGGFAGSTTGYDAIPQHAVLWGRGYQGCNVSQTPTYLDAGAYSFAYFDPDQGAAYQGWIAVNSGGDDVLSALNEWRDSVHRQEEWLAFEYKINGKYDSHDPAYFKKFNNQLTNLRRLEGKINKAIQAEQKDRQQMCQWQNQYLGDAEVVLMPGAFNSFGQPSTMPAFHPVDLATVQSGQPVTKIILAGDFNRSMEKLDRLYDLQDEMRRCRAVLAEEIVRLENRRNYFRLTSHLFNHDYNFSNNEQRVQEAQSMLSNIDRQIAENRRHGHAILAVVGLFAPEEADLAFDKEQSQIRAEKAVWNERLRQVELQFDDASMWNEKRVSLERQRQYYLGQLEECDTQLDQCDQANNMVAQLRKNTGVIYRSGPTSVLAASFLTDSVPARLASAIEQESMMTIRLQSAEGVRPSQGNLTEGAVFNEQMYMLTSDRPNWNQQGGNWQDFNNNDGNTTLNQWSNTQRSYGHQNYNNQHNHDNCGQTNFNQP